MYVLPGLWIIISSYSCRSAFCDLPAIVYSALPIPFLRLFYILGAVLQGVSWWQAAWPMPGAILAAASLVCNTAAIYFAVLLMGRIFKRKVTAQP